MTDILSELEEMKYPTVLMDMINERVRELDLEEHKVKWTDVHNEMKKMLEFEHCDECKIKIEDKWCMRQQDSEIIICDECYSEHHVDDDSYYEYELDSIIVRTVKQNSIGAFDKRDQYAYSDYLLIKCRKGYCACIDNPCTCYKYTSW